MGLVCLLLIIALIGTFCGLISNKILRIRLINFRENLFEKCKGGLLWGFILLFFNLIYWAGNIGSIIILIFFSPSFNLGLLFCLDPLWYSFIYIVARMGFDRIFGDSPIKPYLQTDIALFSEGYRKIFQVLEINLNAPLGKLRHRWTMPAGKYIACYLWDSAFISQIWKYWDQNVAAEILLSILENQAEDGQIAHFISFISKSNKTQPPLLAWAIANLETNTQYLKTAYFKLKKYNQWLYQNRRLENGLFFWMHSYESGIDNSPRFTDRSEKQQFDLTNRAAIDLNTFMVLQNQSLIKIAKKLKIKENDEDFDKDIKEFKGKNQVLIELIQQFLWDRDAGLYFDYDCSKKEQIRINTIVSFFPLIAGIPTQYQAEHLIEHLKNPEEYNTLIPLPTVALNDETFEKDTWRGPMWVNTAYLIIKGLERYGQFQLSSEFAFRIIRAVFKTWENEGSFYEFYDPERFDLVELTRKKGNLWKQITLGGKPVKNFIGWTGLVNSLFIESVIGFDQIEKTIQPRLPPELKGKSITLGFPKLSFEMEIKYSDEKNISVILTDLTGTRPRLHKSCELFQRISLGEFFDTR
ncbi:MAG TPA: trehalase family glycosidase [Candidatus Deferrimicrobium sp.]|nr:trehalase family glycosidase [Candidatus Deferrimicrobium sp.]